MSSALDIVVADIYAPSTRDSFINVFAGRGDDKAAVFEREAAFAVQILEQNDYSLKIAKDNRQSVINAITNVSALGVSLNPARKQAYLVPRDGKICLDVSYMGLIDLAVECGAIVWAQAQVVYETESLEIHGYDKPPTHTRNPFAKDKGAIIGAYCVAKLPSGDYLTETMSADELFAVRDRSSAWKAWIEKKKKCPWVTDEAEMCRKTVVKRASKYWPRVSGDDRIDRAIHHINVDGSEGLAEVVAQPPAAIDQCEEGIKEVRRAKNMADLLAVYGKYMAIFAEAKDRASAEKFKSEATKRRSEIQASNTVEEGKAA